ncbi:MAG: glycoside hydrolase family 31 protein [Bacteroidota bacterium]
MNQESVVHTRELFPGQLLSYTKQDHVITFRCDNGLLLNVYVLTDEIFRFRFAPEGYFLQDFSYAIAPDFHPAVSKLQIVERKNYVSIRTASVECRLAKNGLHTTMLDLKGKVILQDDKGFHWEDYEHGGAIVMMSKVAQEEEHYFGLGDKSCHLNLRGMRLQNWNTDCFGYGPDTDPLYRSIPFYYGLHHGQAYGLFFDNPNRTLFDFAKERKDATSFWAHHGEMNYYYIHGPQLISVAERYAQLTGRPELPPLWTLGFHQCKWSYFPESVVKDTAANFRERNIPCDAIYLDIDYMDGYRCFTWNKEYFPDPARMIRELNEDGFKTIVMIDPGIKVDLEYDVFKEGLEKDAYLKNPDGTYAKGNVWPGPCVFPDYTKPDVREWWGTLYKDLIRKMGVHAFWNDMNEPAVFEVESKTLPEDVRFDYEGIGASHAQGHNIYGMQMSRASFDGIKEYLYPNRPFLITRASYAGGQRYASVWTGDNVASWEHLLLASTQCQRLSVSGFSFCGSDVGGFNDQPDGELFVRWMQLAIFHPLYRVHSIGYNDTGDSAIDEEAVARNMETFNRDQEPWSFGEPYTSMSRKAIELRYRLLPVLYTAFWQNVTKGTPVLRPMSFMYQEDAETLHRMEEFMVGDNLVAVPVSEQGATSRGLYLPKGHWYDFRDEKEYQGGKEFYVPAPLESVPIFVKGGAVIPLAPIMQYVGEKKIQQHEVHAYYTEGRVESVWYQDEGDGYEYEGDCYRLTTFTLKGDGRNLELTQRHEGHFVPTYETYKIVLHGIHKRVSRCLVDGKPVSYYRRGTILEIKVPRDFGELQLG